MAAALVVGARRLAGRSATAGELSAFFSGRGERGSSGPCGTKEIVAAELVAKLKKMISLIMEAYELELRLLKQGGGGSNDLCGSGIQGY